MSKVQCGTRGNILQYLAQFIWKVNFSGMVFDMEPGVFDILMRCSVEIGEFTLI